MSIKMGGQENRLSATRQRVILAVLLQHANQVVSLDHLADVVWDGRRTRAAPSTIYSYVMRLRRTLGAELGARLKTCVGGYTLQVAPGELDVDLFTDYQIASRRALDQQRWPQAASLLHQALGLWRGEPYGDVPAESLRDEAGHLREQWLTALEWRNEAELRLGHANEVIPLLRRLVAEHPLREPFAEQLMRALSQVGRPVEALTVYQSTRRDLVEEIGLGPGRELQDRFDTIVGMWPESDDVRGHGAIISRAVPMAPAQLPAGAPDFTGRERVIADLHRLLRADDARPGAGPVVTVTGGAGVGKTALALHVGHQLRDRFRDGQLYIDLGGSTSQPMIAADALERLLRSLAIDASVVPDTADERAALLRSVLADRQVLMVLDNAVDAEQVRLLLPGTGACGVIITSRNRLSRITCDHSVALDVLDEHEAHTLFARMVGHRRVAAEAQAATSVLRACDGLPLAIRLAGLRINGRPGWDIATLATRLTDESGRLRELRWGQDSVSARFDASLRSLPTEVRCAPAAVLPLLGLVRLPDLGLVGCAVLAGTTVPDVEYALEMLVDAHLVEPGPPNRYRLHDLLRIYARERSTALSAHERRSAVERLLEWYLHSAYRANAVLMDSWSSFAVPQAPADDLTQTFPTKTSALEWYQQEEHCLALVVRHAADSGLHSLAWRLAVVGEQHFQRLGRRNTKWLEALDVALTSARRSGDHLAEASVSSGQAGDHTLWRPAAGSAPAASLTDGLRPLNGPFTVRHAAPHRAARSRAASTSPPAPSP
jgi:DNA-binding SARP family transcriptional activator